MPDHEPALGIDIGRMEPEWLSGFHIAERADLLLHDSQYTADEYAERVGWGHSCIEHVVLFSQRAGVDRLVLFHHDPLHSDAELEAMAERAAKLWGPRGTRPSLAYEGMEIDLGSLTRGATAEEGEPRSPPRMLADGNGRGRGPRARPS